jgi:ABC-type Zn uptake system ZnuABC Zn-binding protein ZnuA
MNLSKLWLPELCSQRASSTALRALVPSPRHRPGSSAKTSWSCILLLTLSLANAKAQSPDKPLVLTALAPVYGLTAPLLTDTTITLQLLPDSPRTLQAQTTVFTRQADRYADTFRSADAVISIGKVWPADPFYTTAREFNIRVVAIDASKPWSHELDGVAVANSPATNTPSPYVWLSPGNAIRMLDTISTDLQALYPVQAAMIKANTESEKALWQQLKREAESRLLTIDDPAVYSLADEFVYLTSDLGLFVDGWFVKQDIDWTAADLTALTARLQESGVKVVLHKWEPSDAIKNAVSAAGATLVVLDTLETTTDFRAGFARNLDALLAAFTSLQ